MPLPVRVYLDPELRVMHAVVDCPAAKMAVKYGYQKSVVLHTVEEARVADSQYRACDLCEKKMEAARGPATTAPSRQHRYQQRSTLE